MMKGTSRVLEKINLAIVLVLWYITATANGLFSRSFSKYLLTALGEGGSLSVPCIIQISIALSFVQLVLTGVGGLGALYTGDVVRKGVATPCSRPSHVVGMVRRHSSYLIAMLNFLGVVSTNVSFFLGSVSVTHLIKSSEPLFTSMYSCIISPGSPLRPRKFSGMILTIVGVATASYSNTRGSYYAGAAALLSSLLFPLRNVLIKKVAREKEGVEVIAREKEGVIAVKGLQVFYVISFVSSVIGLLGILLLHVSPVIRKPWIEYMKTVSLSPASSAVYFNAVMSAITFVSYNTCSMIILQQCSVSTHAIFNILKRGIVIMTSAVYIDQNLNQHLILGTSLVMIGLWLYT